jgi:cell wall-associated NlpC family hydrolase
MGIDAAIGRIDQILQFEQQVFGGSATASTASASGGAAIAAGSATTTPATSSTASSGAANFATALAAAQSAQSDATTTSAAAPVATMQNALASSAVPLSSGAVTLPSGAVSLTPTSEQPSASVPAAVQAMIEQANALVGEPYVWGGGHASWAPASGYDCSGFVSAVLHAGGYLSSPQDTQTLPSATGIEPGPGQYVTIYDRTNGTSPENDHVIIDLGGQFYESGGESGPWGGGGGVQRIATPTAAYLATFNQILHPVGL